MGPPRKWDRVGGGAGGGGVCMVGKKLGKGTRGGVSKRE